MLILDWDDTLYPTSVIRLNQPYSIFDMERVDIVVEHFLRFMTKYFDEIIILSNGSAEWLNYSIGPMFRTRKWIEDHQILVLSARDEYEPTGLIYPRWKLHNLLYILSQPKYVKIKKIVGVGDSDIDYIAVNKSATWLDKECYFYKFDEQQDIPKLINSIEKVAGLIQQRMTSGN